MKIICIGHSGFLVQTEGYNLIFDYYTDKAGVVTPDIFKGRKTCVFVSHAHGDHYNEGIYEWVAYGDVSYVLDVACHVPESAMKALDGKSGGASACGIYKLNEGETFTLPHMNLVVSTFGSTDEGLSYLVRTGGPTLFHSGDLNNWYWADEETPEELDVSEGEFLRIIKRLPVNEIDIAFVPEDPRLGKHAGRAVKQFMDVVKPGRIIPMHFPGNDGAVV